ncbi:unnamed protein product [Acanthoscelides obtectus]|uniref:Uncharacterized protein n=1 Tax=Acanthoscelides obtectus TaxID=200917 RepID=A0A9P0QHP2_ACAOB|nr:unnamed protein product [Acanthoscelides obtectus]CAK1683716.1 hypothetical protein AOBTE_LOCUS34424 [Acanthoscelides obtectus]
MESLAVHEYYVALKTVEMRQMAVGYFLEKEDYLEIFVADLQTYRRRDRTLAVCINVSSVINNRKLVLSNSASVHFQNNKIEVCASCTLEINRHSLFILETQ